MKCIVGQFFLFVAKSEPTLTLSMEVCFEQVRVEAFLDFVEKTGKAASTIGNKAKILTEMLNWINIQEEFIPFFTKINCINR